MKAVEITDISLLSTSQKVEMMTGYTPFDLWRCEHVESGVQCREIATLELGRPSKWQLCAACVKRPAYSRFRSAARMEHSHSVRLLQEFRDSRAAAEASHAA